MTNCPTTVEMSRTNKKKIWWRFQQHDRRTFFSTIRYHMRHPKCAGASHILAQVMHQQLFFIK
jgi:hypothetical protein